MKVRKIIANYYDTEQERNEQEQKAKDVGLKILYRCELENEYGFTYEICYK